MHPSLISIHIGLANGGEVPEDCRNRTHVMIFRERSRRVFLAFLEVAMICGLESSLDILLFLPRFF